MVRSNISRRSFGAAAAVSAVAVPALSSKGATPASPAPTAKPVSGLLSPLAAGDALGHWRLVEVAPLTDGAVSIVLRDAAGTHFQLDVCRRDPEPGAPRGPGQTERYEVFLANSGDGTLRTRESHGLAAMAIADVIRGNEANLDASGFATLRARERRGLARSRLP
ncbi:MAG TPA: hypothetical protein PKD61_08755 [Polyangiaceae bacterium]|nr:hypothetical protein [Polyangiaceae bacterium]